MSNPKHIDIPTPCHLADWNKMDKVTAGRHCTVCDRTVVDFTTMTKEQVIKTLSCGEKICGSFTTQQLERFNASPISIHSKIAGWKKAMAAAVLIMTSLPILRSEAKAHQAITLVATENNRKLDLFGQDTIKTITITGKITDTLNLPLPQSAVFGLGTKYKTITDANGVFQLTIPDTTSFIGVSSLGFRTQKISIKKGGKHRYDVTLKVMPMVLGEVRIAPPIKKP